MTAALIIVSLAGAVAFVVQELRVRSAKETIRQLQNKASVLSEDLKLANELVRTLREEVSKKLDIIRGCNDPAAIRDLAEQLLNDPYFSSRKLGG